MPAVESAISRGWAAFRDDAGNMVGPVCPNCITEEEKGTVLGAEEWQEFYNQIE
jgi:hypothetical protein